MVAVSYASFAQDQDPAVKEKEFRETIDKEIERLTDLLKLEDWQIFYVDSIMTHDFTALREELEDMNRRKVENIGLYEVAQDKWAERIYQAYKKVLSESQWTLFNKKGAAREKAARDKRAAKRK